MPVSVCFVVAMQKRSKNEVARKIPKKFSKIVFIGRVLQLEGDLWGWPIACRHPRGATRGCPRNLAAWARGAPPGTPFGSYLSLRRKNLRYPIIFSRSDPDLCRHRNLASGVARFLFRYPAEEGLGPRGHLHQPFFTP